MVASQAGAPLSPWNLVWTRSGSMAATVHPAWLPNAARWSFWLMGCGPAYDRPLWSADVPWRRLVLIGRVPRLPCHPLVAGRLPRHLVPFPAPLAADQRLYR
ncbi:hypothetical protein [Actinosynnema sp. ALI-1.44]|uniref:hypothetical protein n=1 Tax=Actinosynnema sp. ALI-1.44 TaxID=1933779 RepID=UPI00143DDBFB|nr:hypothetical protein [Actinosynnema sp. ALI-1.44]